MTVRETIRRETPNLTASERKIANAVLADYPYGALRTIQELAERSGVSAPSITRFVSKIGFAGYQEFQRQLIGELREGSRSPLDLKATERLSRSDFVADYARRSAAIVSSMASAVSQEQFDRIVALLSDQSRAVFLSAAASAIQSPASCRSTCARSGRASTTCRRTRKTGPIT